MIKIKHKVNRLREGSTIGLISPSSSAPEAFPIVYQKGIYNLAKYFNLRIKEFTSTKRKFDTSKKHVLARVKDIHDAFLDKEVDAIVTTIGGDDCIRLLPYLDKKIIEENPKIVMGFSDATNLLVYLAKMGIPSFHGPALMAGLAEPEGLSEEFVKHLKSFFFDKWKTYKYERFAKWTEDKYGWSDENFLNRKKKYVDNTMPHIINTGTKNEGVLMGGCIEIIEMLKGTEFGLNADDWHQTAFFFETSEDKPSPDYVRCALRSYGMVGAWDNASMILIGKSRGYTPDEYRELEEGVRQVVIEEFGAKDIRIISNLDMGHTQPIHVLPTNCKVKVDDIGNITLIETPFI